MKHILFYFQYAYRSIRRGGRWTTLAIFCIAAGVASVVALRGLGLAIGDSLVENFRQSNRGDIRLSTRNNGGSFGAFFTFGEDATAFTPAQIDAVRKRAEQEGAKVAAYTRGGSLQVAKVTGDTFDRPQSISVLIIDPSTYPPTHTILTSTPANVPLPDVFTDDNDIVISQNMAEQQKLTVGDQVRVGGTEALFTVVAIVPTETEASVENILAGFFGFAYIDLKDARATLGKGIEPNSLAVKFETPPTGEPLNSLAAELVTLVGGRGKANVTTIDQILERSAQISRLIGDFIVVLGLGALLIGGVGIMNTMLVMVRRRMIEIASLKTFGLKARQVALLFLVEGLMLGLAGSILGSVIGVLLGGIVNHYGAMFLQQNLVWKIYPEAIGYGFALGLIITAIFGLVPVMLAVQVRPGIILRPNETHAPRSGVIQSLLLVVFIVISIGLVVGQIVQPSFALMSSFNSQTPYLFGVIGVAVTMLFLGILVMFLWVIVWLIGKLPAFGSVTLRLALRNLSTQRLRTAITLLALSAGMFALSSITFVGEGTRQLLNTQLSQQFGGNVLVFPLAPGQLGTSIGKLAINAALTNVKGIESRTTIGTYQLDLRTVNGQELPQDSGINPGILSRDRGTKVQAVGETVTSAPFFWNNVVVWDTTDPNLYNRYQIIDGRNLTLADRGQRVVIGPAAYAAQLGITVGSVVQYRVNGALIDYTVVGLFKAGLVGLSPDGAIMPPDVLPGASPLFQFYTLQVQPDHVSEALVQLSTIRIPPTFAIDIGLIDSFLSRLIAQFAAIPTIVALLSLFAAAVIMANTVALATLERRRQIGILKAMGLKSRRVLIVMLLETGIIGALSAVLGIGLSSVFVTLFTAAAGTPIPLPNDARIVVVLLVLAALGIACIATLLSASVATRERVMNVLRYE